MYKSTLCARWSQEFRPDTRLRSASRLQRCQGIATSTSAIFQASGVARPVAMVEVRCLDWVVAVFDDSHGCFWELGQVSNLQDQSRKPIESSIVSLDNPTSCSDCMQVQWCTQDEHAQTHFTVTNDDRDKWFSLSLLLIKLTGLVSFSADTIIVAANDLMNVDLAFQTFVNNRAAASDDSEQKQPTANENEVDARDSNQHLETVSVPTFPSHQLAGSRTSTRLRFARHIVNM